MSVLNRFITTNGLFGMIYLTNQFEHKSSVICKSNIHKSCLVLLVLIVLKFKSNAGGHN